MTDPPPNPHHIKALDDLIDSMERGDLSPEDLASQVKAAAPVNQAQGGPLGPKQAIGGFATIQVTLATITMTIFAGAKEVDAPLEPEDLPDEITLDDLLRLRRRLTGS